MWIRNIAGEPIPVFLDDDNPKEQAISAEEFYFNWLHSHEHEAVSFKDAFLAGWNASRKTAMEESKGDQNAK